MRIWRVGVVGIALAEAACFSACRLKREFPPQPVKVIGVSYGPEGATKVSPPMPENRSISAAGDAAVPTLALDPLQGRLVAIQMAKQAARRELARQIEAVRVAPGQTVADVIRNDPEKRQKVENLIREARQKGLIKTGGGKCSVFLSVELRRLNNALGLGTLVGTADSSATQAREEFRERIQKEALDNARLRALQFIQTVRVRGDETVGDRMSRDQALDRAIRQKIEFLPQSGATFHENGTCEVTVILDLADIQALVTPRFFRFDLPRFLSSKKNRQG